MKKKQKYFAVLGILISVFMIAIFIESIFFREKIQSLLSSGSENYGYLFIAVLSGILEFIPQFIAPTFLMINAAVLKIPLLQTTASIIIGSTLGSLAGFFIGKKFGRAFTEQAFGEKKVKKIEKLLNNRGKLFVTIGALTPLPYVPIIFGSLGMNGKNFLLYGIIPRAASYILLWQVIELGIYIL